MRTFIRLLTATSLLLPAISYGEEGRSIVGYRKAGHNLIEFVECDAFSENIQQNCLSISEKIDVLQIEEYVLAKQASDAYLNQIATSVVAGVAAAGAAAATAVLSFKAFQLAGRSFGAWMRMPKGDSYWNLINQKTAIGVGTAAAVAGAGSAYGCFLLVKKSYKSFFADPNSDKRIEVLFDPGHKEGALSQFEKDLTILLAQMHAYFSV